MDLEVLLYTTVLVLVNILGAFTSEIGFRTPKNQRSEVLALVNVLGIFTSEIGFRTPKMQRSEVL